MQLGELAEWGSLHYQNQTPNPSVVRLSDPLIWFPIKSNSHPQFSQGSPALFYCLSIQLLSSYSPATLSLFPQGLGHIYVCACTVTGQASCSHSPSSDPGNNTPYKVNSSCCCCCCWGQSHQEMTVHCQTSKTRYDKESSGAMCCRPTAWPRPGDKEPSGLPMTMATFVESLKLNLILLLFPFPL